MKDNLKNRKLKICFVSLSSYPLLKGINLGYVGGAEGQQVILAKELRKRGYKISFITYGEKNKNIEIADGIEIYPAYERSNVKKINYFNKAIYLIRKIKNVDADIYYYHGGSPGIVSMFCKLLQKKVIYIISSDAIVTGESIIQNDLLSSMFINIAHYFDIKLANIIIAQNNFQKLKLKERFNVDSIVLKNFLNIPQQFNKRSIGEYLLWIGTIRSVKQPELFLKIAQFLPEYDFVMIGGEGENLEFYKKIKKAADKIKNVDFKGFISPQEINSYYQKAILLINTSKTEGFPNIFLEAWANSIPVVSLNINPDEIITKYKLGFHSKTFDQILDDIKTMLNDRELLDMKGKNGRKYVEENHDIIKVADQHENLIKKLVNPEFRT